MTSSFVGKEAVAGAISGAATRFICQPLDVLKIRFQVCHLVYTSKEYVLFNEINIFMNPLTIILCNIHI